MREILFRGKRVCDNEWMYGDYEHFYLQDGELIVYISDWGKGNEKVFPNTIGQYTGLTDKNGKKIFEGDIVNIDYYETTVINAVIEWVGAGFVASTEYDDWELDNFGFIEIVGNIHDNLELLKGE